MSKLYHAKIDLAKIDKEKIFVGKKGKYIDLAIWLNDEADNYGNICQSNNPQRRRKQVFI